MLFRPAIENDLPAVMRLAKRAGAGMTSLPHDEQRLLARMQRSVDTFAGRLPAHEQGFLFVLEDPDTAQVVGVSAIEVAVGLSEPFYNFRIQRTVGASRDLGVYKNLELLTMSYDHTGHSELCTLFLDPDYQKNRNGLLLSKARFLFIASFRELFSAQIFAEMRGVLTDEGKSPFWDALGHHFFAMPFVDADRMTGCGAKTFIAELMPSYPIYINLLPEDARAVIGQVHERTAPARSILEKEGFRWTGSVDIFDAGPVLEAETDRIRAIKESYQVAANADLRFPGVPTLVSNTQFKQFRAMLLLPNAQGVIPPLDNIQMDALQIAENDPVRLVALNPEESTA